MPDGTRATGLVPAAGAEFAGLRGACCIGCASSGMLLLRLLTPEGLPWGPSEREDKASSISLIRLPTETGREGG